MHQCLVEKMSNPNTTTSDLDVHVYEVASLLYGELRHVLPNYIAIYYFSSLFGITCTQNT